MCASALAAVSAAPARFSQPRSTQRYASRQKEEDEDALRLALIRLAKQYGRYGYRKITALLRIEGWKVNHKKVERLWREEGLQVPDATNPANDYRITSILSFACVPCIQTISGALTLFRIGCSGDAATGCLPSWMNIHASV